MQEPTLQRLHVGDVDWKRGLVRDGLGVSIWHDSPIVDAMCQPPQVCSVFAEDALHRFRRVLT
jgi:hypothetical protein